MSGTPSMFFREAILREAIRKETVLTSMFVALTRHVPDANCLGSSLDEPVGNGYLRVSYDYGISNWELSGFGELYNTSDIFFSEPDAYWGLMQGWALVDAASAGTVLAVGSLVNPRRADVGFTPVIRAGGLIVALYD